MTTLALLLAAHLVVPAQEQDTRNVQELFEAGQYEVVLQRVAAAEASSPSDRYLAGQSALELTPPDEEQARARFSSLLSEATDPWTFVARSELALLDGNLDGALAAAKKAATLGPTLMYTHYQLGHVYARRKDMVNAATSFEKATTADPRFAYAHYYAGMSYYQLKRIDKMATFFEYFLKLAPEAPERPAVESIMRTIRGR